MKVQLGETIFTSPIVASVLRSINLRDRCSCCFVRSRRLKSCARCQVVMYCDVECQRYDWKLHHKHECSDLVKYMRSELSLPDETCRLIGRILRYLSQQAQLGSIYAETILDRTYSFHDVPCPLEEIESDDVAHERMLSCYRTLSKYLARWRFSAVQLKQAYARVHTYATYFVEVEQRKYAIRDLEIPLGESSSWWALSFSIGANVVGHSCAPNAVLHFIDGVFHVKAIQPMDVDCFDDLTINYLPCLRATPNRRQLIMERLFFFCDCLRCRYILPDIVTEPTAEQVAFEQRVLQEVSLRKNGSSELKCKKVTTFIKDLLRTEFKDVDKWNETRLQLLSIGACLAPHEFHDHLAIAYKLAKTLLPFRKAVCGHLSAEYLLGDLENVRRTALDLCNSEKVAFAPLEYAQAFAEFTGEADRIRQQLGINVSPPSVPLSPTGSSQDDSETSCES